VGCPVRISVAIAELSACDRYDGSIGRLVWLRVHWTYNADADSESDFRQWDFVALHRKGAPCEDYEASRYIMSHMSGIVELVAPSIGGEYEVSVVRDRRMVLMAMAAADPPRAEEYSAQVRPGAEDLVQLAVVPCVCPVWPDIGIDVPRVAPVGSTGGSSSCSLVVQRRREESPPGPPPPTRDGRKAAERSLMERDQRISGV